ncbi:MAG TPA: hypothetical protein VN915_03285 [Elusimicrobiota bacterium]|nr:hypothetical protein [Elusimicrobiota bacterium]
MSAWLLAAILCAPASAQVFEAGGAAAPAAPVPGAIGASAGAGAPVSPVSAVPGASVLAPSLNSAVLAVFPGRAATSLPAGAVRLAPAPLPALPAAAAVSGAAPAAPASRDDRAPQPGPAPARRDVVPPSLAPSVAAARAVAADRRRGAETDASPERASARLGPAGRELAAPGEDAGGLDLLSAEGSAELGRKLFDRVEDRPALGDGAPGGAPGELIADGASPARDPLLTPSDGADSGVETLRDAVASPIAIAPLSPAAAAPAGALSFFRRPAALLGSSARGAASPASGAAAPRGAAAPVSFEKLTLELGSGLVVRVQAALGFASSSRPLAAPAPNGAAAVAAPVTSTEWLERRGLLESLSASEAAAVQQAASGSAAGAGLAVANGLAPAVAPHASAARSRAAAAPLAPAAPAPVPAPVWWALAFLPAGLVLLRELL